MALAGLDVVGEQSVAKPEQLHDTLVLTNIFMAFKDMGMRLAVASLHFQFPRSLLGLNDSCHRIERDDTNNRLADAIRSGNSKLKIMRIL